MTVLYIKACDVRFILLFHIVWLLLNEQEDQNTVVSRFEWIHFLILCLMQQQLAFLAYSSIIVAEWTETGNDCCVSTNRGVREVNMWKHLNEIEYHRKH